MTFRLNDERENIIHCVKSVEIQSFFWAVFSSIRAEYGGIRISLRIQFKCGKIRARKNSVFGHFSRSISTLPK